MTKKLQSTVDLIRCICISLSCNTSGISSPRLEHQLCVLNIQLSSLGSKQCLQVFIRCQRIGRKETAQESECSFLLRRSPKSDLYYITISMGLNLVIWPHLDVREVGKSKFHQLTVAQSSLCYLKAVLLSFMEHREVL